MGRLPVLVGDDDDGHCVCLRERLPITSWAITTSTSWARRRSCGLRPMRLRYSRRRGDEMKICAFLWVYYGYPNSNYEGMNVEVMRYRNGAIMARDEAARGACARGGLRGRRARFRHAACHRLRRPRCKMPFGRPFIKYTPTWPRSFMPANQDLRNQDRQDEADAGARAHPRTRSCLFVDDSIVRGTQLRETVNFLYESGAAEVHMRSRPARPSCTAAST